MIRVIILFCTRYRFRLPSGHPMIDLRLKKKMIGTPILDKKFPGFRARVFGFGKDEGKEVKTGLESECQVHIHIVQFRAREGNG